MTKPRLEIAEEAENARGIGGFTSKLKLGEFDILAFGGNSEDPANLIVLQIE